MGDARLTEMFAERRAAVTRLRWFDAGVWLGKPQGFPLAQEMQANDVGGLLREYGIGSALLSHWLGKSVSPQAGNQALAQCAGTWPEIAGVVWTGVPWVPGEEGPLPGQTPASAETKVRGVRLFPKSHSFPLVPWCVGEICKWLVERQLPLFLWHTELNWAELYTLAKAFPELPIVIESQPQKIIYHARALLPLMSNCANVHLEISNLTGPLFAMLLSHLGPERFVFGSFLPMNDPWVPVGMVIDSGLPRTDQQLIAADNLQRLAGAAS